jgi:tetratricopeptide (TPR) repeat protein
MKKLIFILFSLCIPVLAIVLLEVILRLFIPGRPPEIIRKLGEVEGRSFMLYDRVGPASFFGPQAHRITPVEINGFFLPKPTNTLRVILTGESAMRGFPQPIAFTAGSFLQEMLKDRFPDKNIEILNFSATAVASYPVMKITEAALACDPDIIITMVGHNEFFGAYGVVATRHFGSFAGLFDWDYRLRHTATGRLVAHIMRPRKVDGESKQLMEMMAGMNSIPVDHPLRVRAHENFSRHLTMIANSCSKAGIPLIICVPPSNETGLYPIGPDGDSGRVDGRTAREAFSAAQTLQQSGQHANADVLFRDARDRDPMPWRASSRIQATVREIAGNYNANLCDFDRAFRNYLNGDGIGWNLMDDHVHPNIDGQALMAETLTESIWQTVNPGTELPPSTKTRDDYLRILGDNMFDRFVVSATMTALFQIPFLADSNPEAKVRLEKDTKNRFDQLPQELHEAVRQLRQQPMLTVGKRPFSGLAAMEYLKMNQKDKAIPLLAAAIRSVPPYSSWSIEYNYYLLAAVKDRDGKLSEQDWQNALAVLSRAQILLGLGAASSGQTERYAGRILQLFDKQADAITFLIKARQKLNGMDRVANDRALIEAYQKTGQKDEAARIIREGLAGDPSFTRFYR